MTIAELSARPGPPQLGQLQCAGHCHGAATGRPRAASGWPPASQAASLISASHLPHTAWLPGWLVGRTRAPGSSKSGMPVTVTWTTSRL